MPRLVLLDATVLDADGARPRTTVVIEDRRIATVRTGAPRETGPEDRVVDLGGRTVMPGMVSSHFHATYNELGSKAAPFGLEEPPALQAVRRPTISSCCCAADSPVRSSAARHSPSTRP